MKQHQMFMLTQYAENYGINYRVYKNGKVKLK